jgi:hypothetical protein
MSIRSFTAAAIIAASSIAATTTHAQFINDSFTYQGTLNDNGAPANGLYDITFLVYDDEVGGSPVSSGTVTVNNVQVTDGLFSTEIDFGVFGSIFDSNTSRWLELRVSEAGIPGATILEPRQKLTPATLANYALRAGYAAESGTTLNDAYRNDNNILFQDTFGPLNLIATPAQSPEIRMLTNLGEARVNLGFENFAGNPFFNLSGPGGNLFFTAQRDVSTGGGGYLALTRNDFGLNGIILDGNYFGSESSRLNLFGSGSGIIFATDQSDNESVALPINAISSTEIFNEVGAAETVSTTTVNLTNDSTAIDTINSVTINAPAGGFAFIIATAEVEVDHINGAVTTGLFGVSNNTANFVSNTDLEIRIPADAPTGQFDYPVTSHAIFPVSEGTNTFYFLGDDNLTGGSSFTVFDRQVSAIYIPTSYGSLALDAAPNIPDEYTQSTPPMSAYDILAEQNAALQADNERQQRELDEMREMMEEIKREMQREQRLQTRD